MKKSKSKQHTVIDLTQNDERHSSSNTFSSSRRKIFTRIAWIGIFVLFICGCVFYLYISSRSFSFQDYSDDSSSLTSNTNRLDHNFVAKFIFSNGTVKAFGGSGILIRSMKIPIEEKSNY
jgi:hypothetical protein